MEKNPYALGQGSAEPIDVHNLDDLIHRMRTHVSANRCLIIGVDGTDGAGKTFLAQAINKSCSGNLISVDSYLDQNKGEYFSNIRFDELKQEIERLRKKESPLFIEGICLLKILDKIETKPNILVYVKHIDRNGYWRDERFCDPTRSLEDKLDSIIRIENSIGIGKGPGNLDREIVEYHHNYKPQEKANYIFLRADEPRKESNDYPY